MKAESIDIPGTIRAKPPTPKPQHYTAETARASILRDSGPKIPDFTCSGTDKIADESELIKVNAELQIRKNLKDPYTARFHDFVYARLSCSDGIDRHVACANVNAKNSYGGYGGMKRWTFTVGADHKGVDMWTEDETSVTAVIKGSNGERWSRRLSIATQCQILGKDASAAAKRP